MAKKRTEHGQRQDNEGFLVSTAKALGHAAGTTARTIGLADAEGSTPAEDSEHGESRPKKVSLRARRIADAEAVKAVAVALGKNPFPNDVHYRRIVGKKPALWSLEDIDYVKGLLAVKSRSAA